MPRTPDIRRADDSPYTIEIRRSGQFFGDHLTLSIGTNRSEVVVITWQAARSMYELRGCDNSAGDARGFLDSLKDVPGSFRIGSVIG